MLFTRQGLYFDSLTRTRIAAVFLDYSNRDKQNNLCEKQAQKENVM